MSDDRAKKPAIVYIQRDLEAIKHTLDKVLRPYKADVKQLRAENVSLRIGIARANEDIEKILRLIVKRHPDLLDDALASLLDQNRRGWRKFRSNWRQRLGLEREE